MNPITTGQTVRWPDKNGSPLIGVVVSIGYATARVATPYGQTLEVSMDQLAPMKSAALNIQPDSVRLEPKNPAAVALGRKGGAAKVSKGPLANKTPEQRAAWAAKMVAARRAKRPA